MKATAKKYILNFKQASGTSRGVMTEKETWFLILEKDGKKGIGECCIFRGLSYDDRLDYSDKMQEVCSWIEAGKQVDELWEMLREWPSIQFGVEQAFLSLESHNPFILFPSLFTRSQAAIPINGLVWMGSKEFMKSQIDDKLANGFNCIKLKIGAINFQEELDLIQYIRSKYPKEVIEIRVDANGGFASIEALSKLCQLSELELHSIEQPIKQKQYDSMSELCKNTPLPIALDEELIGVVNLLDKENLLDKIKPQYIILKPSLIGGFKGSGEWIRLAEERNIGWWITSALESNIGLNAIAQWTFTLNSKMPQGLGTGALFINNVNSPLEVRKGKLWYNEKSKWQDNLLFLIKF
nr:o-succinylbenzoate synthase [uncultured Flavobacterium sp.]